MNMTLGCLRQQAINNLKDNNIENYILETDLLLMHCLNVSKVFLITNKDKILTNNELHEFNKLLIRRLNNEPIQYIIGTVNFMNITLKVNPYVLIPRSDTEILVTLAEELINNDNNENINVLDLCTGSGCIALSILNDLRKNMNMYASDISENALKTASYNAEMLMSAEKIKFILSSYFDSIPGEIKFDYIISNPPYIKTEEIDTLDEQVKKYEPTLALDGGLDGLDAYRHIIKEAKNRLKEHGTLLLEVGFDQAKSVSNIMTEYNYTDVYSKSDLNGIERVIAGTV